MQDLLIRLFADGALVPLALAGIFVLVYGIPNERKFSAYSRILLAGLTAYLTAKLIATVYQPELERPFEALGIAAGAYYLNNPGFPSDHVLFAMSITLAVWFETKYKRTAAVLFFITLLIAVGRVLAHVHTPIDVIGGFIIALIGVPWYLQRSSRKKPHKSQQ